MPVWIYPDWQVCSVMKGPSSYSTKNKHSHYDALLGPVYGLFLCTVQACSQHKAQEVRAPL